MSVISQIKSILESAVNNKYTVELRIEIRLPQSHWL